jgi:HAD superfamily hydrolase (TIGR01509 family)
MWRFFVRRLRVKGVVLDFDGVLVQSMAQHAEAYRRVLAPFGVNVTDQDIYEREGSRSETIIREMLGARGKDPALVKRLSNEKQETYRNLGIPRLYPGAEEFVRAIRKEAAKLGLVTGTRRMNLERIIPQLLPLFDAVLTADQGYTNDKPDPEPYLRTADALGLKSQECAAVENAPQGVESARRAGYGFVVAITTTMPKERLSHAHQVVSDLAGARKAIVAWLHA